MKNPVRFLVPLLLLLATVGAARGEDADSSSADPRRDLLMFEADNALRNGAFSDAAELLQEILATHPDDVIAMEHLAGAWETWSRVDPHAPDSLDAASLKLWRRILDEDPRHAVAIDAVREASPEEWKKLLDQAAAEEKNGHDRDAERHLRIAFELEDSSAVVRARLGAITRRLADAGPEPERTFYMGRIDLVENRPYDALARFQQCREADTTLFEFKKYEAFALYDSGKQVEALEKLQPLSLAHPEDLDIRFYIGSLLFRLDHYTAALAQLMPVAQRRRYHGEAARMVGVSLSRIGHDDAMALRYLREAESEGSADPELQCQIGESLVRLKEWDEAGKSFERCLTTSPDHPAANLGLALVADENQKWAESVKYFEAFLAKNPKTAPVLFRVGVGWLRLDQPDTAAARFRSAIAADSIFASVNADTIGNDQACEVAFLVMMSAYEYRDGIVVGEHLLKRRPDDATYMNNLAMAFADAEEQLDRALDLAKRANAASPDNMGYLDTLGWVQVRMKKYDEATTTFQRSLDIAAKTGESDVSEILYHRAVLYAGQNRRNDAIVELHKAIEARPNPQIRRMSEALLDRLTKEQKKID